MREAKVAAGCVIVVAIVMFFGPFERFGSGAIDAIRADEQALQRACTAPISQIQAEQALGNLLGFARRDPDQLLPIHGATAASSMRSELTGLAPYVVTGPCAADPKLRMLMTTALDLR
jgi:hypothetical protein